LITGRRRIVAKRRIIPGRRVIEIGVWRVVKSREPDRKTKSETDEYARFGRLGR
jgi:hypothetical protein